MGLTSRTSAACRTSVQRPAVACQTRPVPARVSRMQLRATAEAKTEAKKKKGKAHCGMRTGASVAKCAQLTVIPPH